MADETDVVEIFIEAKTQKVKIGGLLYTLKEMDGIEPGKWRAEMGDRAKFNAAGSVIGMKTYTGVEASLISRCLFDPQDRPVSKDTITGWSTSAQQNLVRLCEKLNGLDKESADEAKKS